MNLADAGASGEPQRRTAQDWAAAAVLEPAEIDCATAVMLKILDGKCKMPAAERTIMMQVYDALKKRPGKCLGPDFHELILAARVAPGHALLEYIYEQRVLAETMISRPVMKDFKARLRHEGVLPPK